MRFQPLFWRMNADDLAEAQKLLHRAIERDPDYALAHALLGFSHIWSAWMGWVADAETEIPKADLAADRAYRISPKDPFNSMLPGIRSIGLFTAGRDAEAMEFAEETLRVRPDWVGAGAFIW